MNFLGYCKVKGKIMSHCSIRQSKEEIARWEEGKKWQAKMEKMKSLLKEKERETETLTKQLSTLKELYGRSVTHVQPHLYPLYRYIK